jgi:hypothetical protein
MVSVVKMPLDRQALERPLLEAPDCLRRGGRRRLGRLAVVLQVDLDPLAVPGQQGEQLVVLGERRSVGVDQHPHDRPLRHGVEQLGLPRVERGSPPDSIRTSMR